MSHIPPVSFGVLSTLSAYRGVAADTAGSNNVIYPSAATVCPIGVTTDSVKDTTSAIPVAIGGICKLEINDSLPTGSFVALDSSGRGVPHVNTTAGSYVIGTHVGKTVTVSGTVSEIVFNPFYKAIP
jgi:hypothetical protein